MNKQRGFTLIKLLVVIAIIALLVVYDITKSVHLVPTPLVKDDLLFLWADDGLIAGICFTKTNS